MKQIPDELRAADQWVVAGPGKRPLDPNTGESAKSNDPATWGSYADAVQAMRETRGALGVGLELHGLGVVCVDLDHCFDDSGHLTTEAAAIVKRLNSYTERSLSGSGLHIFCWGSIPSAGRRRGGVEMYADNRYIIMTGDVLDGRAAIEHREAEIAGLYAELFPDAPVKPTQPTQPAGTLEDGDLLTRAFNAKNGELFGELWCGNWQGMYPSQSEADQAFCNLLAFWTGCDAEQMDRLFRQSNLFRPKWDERHGAQTYGETTISKAIQGSRAAYDSEQKKPELPDVFGRAEYTGGHEPERLSVISAVELQAKEIPPIKWIVSDMIPQGLVLLASPSKYGKSWAVLDLSLAVAFGGKFLDHPCTRGGALYLALEDSERRLKDRMNKILRGGKAPDNFYYATSAKTLKTGLLDQLEQFVEEHPETILIVIDTLQMIRGVGNGKDAYGRDYADMAQLKRFEEKHGLCLLLVHHLRKAEDDTDAFNRISGTNGIMGAADTAMILTRKRRTDEETTLSILGRDVEGSETIIYFDKTSFRWQVRGDAGWLEEQRRLLEYQNNPIVQTVKKLLEQSPLGWRGTARELFQACIDLVGTYPADNETALSKKLKALRRDLYEQDGIIYDPPSGKSNNARKHVFRLKKDQQTIITYH